MGIWVIGGQKGGVGKSTVAVNLAVDLTKRGYRVLIADSDAQKTAENWGKRRQTNDYTPSIDVAGLNDKIHTVLANLSAAYDYVIVDVGARDTPEYRTALMVADLAIMVTQPSQFDLDTFPKVLEIAVDTKKALNPTLKILALTSQVSTHARSRELEDTMTFYQQYPAAIPLNSVTHRRVAYSKTARFGRGVVEEPRSKAADEMRAITDELMTYDEVEQHG